MKKLVVLLCLFAMVASTAAVADFDDRPIVVLRIDDCPSSWRTQFSELDGMSGLEYGKLKQIPITWGIISNTPSWTLTWTELKDYLDTAGGEAASHSVTHSWTNRIEDCIQEVIDSKAAIEANLPGYSCTSFLQPGTWSDDANMNTFSKLSNPLGLAIQANYARSMAYLGGGWRIGDTYYRYGMMSSASVSYSPGMTPASVSAMLDLVAATPGLVYVIMTHGIQEASGTKSGDITSDVLRALMDKLAQLRDEGKLRLLGLHDAYNATFSPLLNRVPDPGFEMSSHTYSAWIFTGTTAAQAIADSGGVDDSRYARISRASGVSTGVGSPVLSLPPGRYTVSWHQRPEPGHPTHRPLYVILDTSQPGKSYNALDWAMYYNQVPDAWEQKSALVLVEENMPSSRLSFRLVYDCVFGIDNVSIVSSPLDPLVSPSNSEAIPQTGACTLSWDTPADPSLNSIMIRYGTRSHPTTPSEGILFGSIAASPGARQEITAPIDWVQLNRRWVYFSVFGIKDNEEFTQPELAIVKVDISPPLTPSIELSILPNATVNAQWASSDPESEVVLYQYAVGTAPGLDDIKPWTTTDQTQATADELPDGLQLHFSVKAKNLFGFWSAVGSRSFVLSPISEIIDKPDDTEVSVSGIVSAVFDGYCYIQQEDRARGIRIIGNFDFAVGDIVGVTGILTTVDGERAIIVE